MIEENIIHDGHFKVVQRESERGTYDIVRTKNAASMLYIDTDDNVYLVRQFREPMEQEIFELPAETIDKEGKTALEIMVEGLEEECGVRIEHDQVKHLTTIFSSPGYSTELVDLFYATGDHIKTQQADFDVDNISVVTMPFNEAYGMIGEGKIQCAKSIILLQNEYIRRKINN